MSKIKVIDLFCGAGGFTSGVEDAVFNDARIADVIACINHDELAIKSHAANHPTCKHYTEDITKFDEHSLPNKHFFPDDVLILHASLECTNFSKAKGGKPRDADSRTLADHLDRYIVWCNPDIITIENVREFLSWGPLDDKGKPVSRLNGRDFMRWRYRIEDLGYKYDHRFLNSANYGAHTSRERYFGMFVKIGLPIVFPDPTHDKKERHGLKKWNPVKEKLDFSNEGKSIFTNPNIKSEKTFERIYAGCVKHIAKGDTSFIAKYNGNNAITGINNGKSIDEPCIAITTQNRVYLVNVKKAFISKYFNGRDVSSSIEKPSPSITTIDHNALVQADFISAYYGNGDNTSNTDRPAPTISTKDRLALVECKYFIDKQYSGDDNHQDIEQPAGTILSNDKHSLVRNEFFIDRNFTSGGQNSSIEKPVGSILPYPKLNLIEAEKFLIDQSFGNASFSMERPAPTILACRKNHYLVNPSYFGHTTSVEDPSPVIVARQDKAPLGLVTLEGDQLPCIIIYPDDSPAIRNIKIFMAAYGISDIKMRMLTVQELKEITGFKPDYYLAGAQQHQKKFIGNAVTPIIPKLWMEAIYTRLIEEEILKAA